MTFFKKLAAFLAALSEGLLGSLFKGVFLGLTGRSLDDEAAEREEAERQQLAAERQHAELEARHDETIAMAAMQAQEMKALREQMRVMAERRERQAAIRRSHENPEPSPEESYAYRRRRRPDYAAGGAACPVPV